MKYKIQKFESGGAMVATYTPMARYDSSSPVSAKNQSSKESDSDSGDMKTVIDKKLYERLITEGGLVNDVNYFVDKINSIGKQPMAYLQNGNINSSLDMIKDLNRIQQNKALWQTTYNTAKELGGLDEVAVGKQGELFVKDGDSFKAIGISEYSKHRDKYNPLTVSELLRARQYDPKLVYNDSVFQVGETANGVTQILKKVDDIIKLVGTDTNKNEQHFSKSSLKNKLAELEVTKSPTAEQAAEMSKIKEILNSPGDQFKLVEETSNKQRYGKVAFDYIISSLTKEEQLKLKAVAAINGTNVDDWLRRSIAVGLSGSSHTQIIDSEKPVETEATESAKNAASNKSMSAFQMFHKGSLYDRNATLNFNDPEWNAMFRGTIESTGPLMTSKDQIIGMTTLQNVLTDGNYNMFVDGNRAFLGDKKITIGNMNNVIVDGQNSGKVYMPVKADGSPDYDSLQTFKDVYAVYEANKNQWSKQTAMEHFRKNGYNLVIDQVGGEKVIRENSQVKPFLVTYGYTNDNTGLTDNNSWLKELDSEEEKEIKPILTQIWTVKNGSKSFDYTPKGGMFHSTDYYKGIIAIPYRSNATAIVDAMADQGPKAIVPSLADVQRNITQSSNLPINRDFSGANLLE